MTKRKAFAIHLGISFIIFLVILALIVFDWYPPPFFDTDGGWQGVRIMVGVDLVLGPLLTLIVYRAGKPGLKFDLTIIGLLQASALVWGIWTVHRERPFAAVFVEDHFSTLPHYQIQSHTMTTEQGRTFGKKAPYWIYSKLPSDPNVMQKLRVNALRMGRPLYIFTEYYHTMDHAALQVMKANSIDMPKWLEKKPLEQERYKEFILQHSEHKNLIFLPWQARQKHVVIALDSENGNYIGNTGIATPIILANIPLLGTESKDIVTNTKKK